MREVLCLHGFTGDPTAWKAVLAEIDAPVQVHAPALLGHAPERPSSDEAKDFEGEVDRLAHWLAARTTGPVHLAGYSMGGRVGVGLLVRHRQLFSGATLVGVHAGLPTEADRRDRMAADEVLARRLETEGIECFVDFWQELPLFASQQGLPAAVLEGQRRHRLRHAPAGLALALRRLGPGRMPNYRPVLAKFDRPVTLVAGEGDAKFRRLAEDLVSRWPSARHRVIRGAGHNPLLEAPTRVAALLAEDLARSPRAALEVR